MNSTSVNNLHLSRCSLGLLITFNIRKLTDGIERVANNAPSLSAPSAFQEK